MPWSTSMPTAKATAVGAYRRALQRFRPLLGGLLLAVAACVVLSVTAVLIPVAIWLAVRCMLLAQAVEAEDCSAFGGLRRGARLVGAGSALLLWSASEGCSRLLPVRSSALH